MNNFIKLSSTISKIIDYRGRTPKKLGLDWSDHGFRALSALNVKVSGLVKTDDLKFGNQELYSAWMKNEVERGDILLTSEAPAGQVMVWNSDEKIILSQRLFALRINKNFDNYFIKYFLQSEVGQKEILKNTSGSTVFGISAKMFELINVPFKNKDEQIKIGLFLKNLDGKIELNNKINIELEQMAKTIYDYWFVQFDFPFDFAKGKPCEEGKPYKSSGGEMVYNAVLKREIPKDWEVKSLFQIANYINGLACQKFRPENETDHFLPVIKIREMNDGISKNTERVRVDIPEKNIINDGDVLFSWSATLDVKIWTEGKAGLNQHIFKVTSDKYPRSFYYFETLNYLHHFKMMAELRKTTMGHITKDHLMESYIPIPPMELVTTLDNKLKPILEKIISNKKQNQELASLRDWLLPMLMNGQVRVGENDGEVLSLVAEERGEYKKPTI